MYRLHTFYFKKGVRLLDIIQPEQKKGPRASHQPKWKSADKGDFSRKVTTHSPPPKQSRAHAP